MGRFALPDPLPAISQPNSGQLRVPYVRSCRVVVERTDQVLDGMTCNISIQGVYVAVDKIPELGEMVKTTLPLPGRDGPTEVAGMVTWRNTRQQHKVHSLPPGCGVRLLSLTPAQQERIDQLVSEYRPLLKR